MLVWVLNWWLMVMRIEVRFLMVIELVIGFVLIFVVFIVLISLIILVWVFLLFFVIKIWYVIGFFVWSFVVGIFWNVEIMWVIFLRVCLVIMFVLFFGGNWIVLIFGGFK